MLALEWTNREIRIVEGQASGSQIKLARAWTVQIPDQIDVTDVEAVGSFLRQKLQASKVRDRRGVSCIDRRSVVLKVISVGNVSENELAGLIRLQAMRDLTLPLEETSVDYVRTSQESPEESPEAVIAVVRNEIVNTYQTLFKSAGLKLEGLWPASLAMVRAAFAMLPSVITHSGQEHFLIVPDGDSVELCLLRGTQFVTSASRPITRAGDELTPSEAFLQTVKRLQASLSGQYTDLKIASVLVAGGEIDPDLIRSLTEQFNADVVTFDPLRSLASLDIPMIDRGLFAGVVGSIAVAAEPPEKRINFLAPKKPATKTDYRRVAAIALLGLLTFAFLFAQQRHASAVGKLEKSIKEAKNEKLANDKTASKLKTKALELAWIQEWNNSNPVFINLLRELILTMPESKSIFFTRMTFAKPANPKAGAVIQLDGFADDPKTIANLNMKLAEQMGFTVEPGPTQPVTRFPGYNWKYSSVVTVPKDSLALRASIEPADSSPRPLGQPIDTNPTRDDDSSNRRTP